MDAKRIKTVLICLLLAVDLLLLAVVGYREYNAQNERVTAARAAVSALEALGTIVSESLILDQPPPLYVMEEERSLSAEFTVWSQAIGASREDFTELGSGIYYAENERGFVRLSNAGLFEITRYSTDIHGVFEHINPAGSEVINGVQHIGGLPIFNRTVTFSEDGNVQTIHGGLLMGEFYTIGDTPSKSAEAALLALSGLLERSGERQIGEVTACEPGYYAELAARGYTTLRPIWRVESASGVWYVDAITLLVTENG